MRQSSASLPVWKFQIGESRQVHCCSDPPPEVVSEASRRLCELISRRHAAGVCRSDVWLSQSDNWTCPSPIKYIPELYVNKPLSSCLSYRRSHFCPKKQRLSPPAEPGSPRGWIAMVIMWHDSEQKTLVRNVFVTFHCCVVVVTISGNLYGIKPLRQSSLPTETSVNFFFFLLEKLFYTS